VAGTTPTVSCAPARNFRRAVRLGTRTVIPASSQPGSNRRRGDRGVACPVTGPQADHH